MFGKDSLGTKKSLNLEGKIYQYFSLKEAAEKLGVDISLMPFSLKIVLENLLRFEDGKAVTVDDIKACVAWLKNKKTANSRENYVTVPCHCNIGFWT